MSEAEWISHLNYMIPSDGYRMRMDEEGTEEWIEDGEGRRKRMDIPHVLEDIIRVQ